MVLSLSRYSLLELSSCLVLALSRASPLVLSLVPSSRFSQLPAPAAELSRSKTRRAFSKVDKKSSVPGAIGFERGPQAPPSAWYRTTAGVSPFFFFSPELVVDRL